MIVLPSKAALATVDASRLRDGQDFFVNTDLAIYDYRRNVGSDTANGRRRIALASGGGLAYRRLEVPHESWLRQATWVVDQTNGSDDAADPGAGNGLKTWDELWLRIGSGRTMFVNPTITVMNGLPVGDPMIVDWEVLDTGTFTHRTTINAASSALVTSGTVAAGGARARNPATRTPNGIKPTGGGTFDWTPYLGTDLFILGTGGGIDNANGWIGKDELTGTAMVSSFLDITNFAEKTVADGDTYQVRRLMRVDAGNFTSPKTSTICRGFVFTNPPRETGAGVTWAGSSIEPAADGFGFEPRSLASSIVSSRVDGGIFPGNLTSMQLTGGLFSNRNFPGTYNGSFRFSLGGGISSGALFVDTSPTFDGSSGGNPGANTFINDCGVFGGTAGFSGIRVYRMACIAFVSKLWGVVTAGGGPAIQCDKSARMLFATPAQGGVFNLVGSNPGVNDIDIAGAAQLSCADAIAGRYNIAGTGAWFGPQV